MSADDRKPGMTGRVVGAAAMAAALTVSSPAHASPAAPPVGEVRIGMIDTMVYRAPIRDRNIKVVSKDMTGGKAARWDGESGFSHGELVAASAIRAARVQNPDARISVFAANVYTASEADANHRAFTRGGASDPDASKVHLVLDYGAADRAIAWMKEEGVSVVVMTATGQDTPRMKALSDRVRESGMVLVASTNNADVRGKVFPAAYPDVISVAGSDRSLPIWNSPELASYVSYLGDARAPLREGPPEIGSSFAAGAVGGVLAARAAAAGGLSTASARQWLDSVAVQMDCGGYKVRRVSSDARYDSIGQVMNTDAVASVSSDRPKPNPAMLAAMHRGAGR